MRATRGGPRASRGTARGGLRSADNSGDESNSRRSSRRVRFDDSNGAAGPTNSRASNGAFAQRTSRNAAAASSTPSTRKPSTRPPRGASNQRNFNNAVSRAARAPSALSRSFGAPSNPSAASTPTRSAPGTQSFAQRYQNLKKTRERERQDAIANGILADPDKPRTLAEAITPTGTCQDMCPEFERVERVVQNDVWGAENAQDMASDGQKRQVDESRMVKKFRRAAAGLDEQLPSDLRPPQVLQKTLDYLFNDLLENAEALSSVHHFIWDRTRAIRNDFSIQQVTKIPELRIAIDCYERIARFHILSLHQLALPEKPYDKYDAQQEREQLDKTLLSLMQYYDDSRGRLQAQNEAEFRAYCIIFQIQDPIPDLEDRAQTWPPHILNDPRVQRALRLYAAACNVLDVQGPLKPLTEYSTAQNNWGLFWRLVASKEISYLMACVAEIYFPLVRRIALNAIWMAYRAAKRTVEDWTLEDLLPVFGFDDVDDAAHFCEQFEFTIKERGDGRQYLDLESVAGRTLPDPPAGARSQARSDVVERKRHCRLYSAVINGMSVRAATDAGMIEERDEEDEEMQYEQSMFIHDSDEESTLEESKSTSATASSPAKTSHSNDLNPFASPWTPADSTLTFNAPQQNETSKNTQSQTASNSFQFGEHNAEPSTFSGSDKAATSISGATTSVLEQHQPGKPDTSASQTSFFSTASSGPSLFPQISGPSSETTKNVPSSSPQSFNPFPTTQNSLFSGATGQNTSNSEPIQGYASVLSASADPKLTPESTKSNPFSFLSAKKDAPESNQSGAATEKERPFAFLNSTSNNSSAPNTPSFFTATSSTPGAPNNQTTFNFNQESNTPAGTPSTKSLFDRISHDKSDVLPPFQNANPLQTQKPETSSQPSEPFQPSNKFGFPISSQQEHSSLASTSAAQPTGSGQLKLPSFSFTSPSTPTSAATQTASFLSLQTPKPSEHISPSHIQSNEPSKSQSQPVLGKGKAPQQLDQEKAAKEAKEAQRSATLDQLARALVTAPGGYLQQYMEMALKPMIQDARQQVFDEKMRAKADEFRLASITRRFGVKWREICWKRRVARQGRERRRRIARGQESRARRSRESSISDAIEDFRSTITKQPAVEGVLPATGTREKEKTDRDALDGTSGSRSSARQPTKQLHSVTDDYNSSVGPLSRSFASESGGHRRSESVPDHFSASAPLGSSRSHLSAAFRPSSLRHSFFPDDAPVSRPRAPPSAMPRSSDTTRSTYFRLKAMGLDPSGLARPSDRKRPRSSDSELPSETSTSKRRTPPDGLSSSPPDGQMEPPAARVPSGAAAIDKSRSASVTSTSKWTPSEDEEKLFAAAREVREKMDEGVEFYRDEMAKDEELRRSTGSWNSKDKTGASPPNANFAAGSSVGSGFADSLRAARGSSEGSSARRDPPPAYRSRVSKFLPRERYAYVLQQQQRDVRGVSASPRREESASAAKNPQTQARRATRHASTAEDVKMTSAPVASMQQSAGRAPTVGAATNTWHQSRDSREEEENAQRPPTRDSMFTPDSSFAAPPQSTSTSTHTTPYATRFKAQLSPAAATVPSSFGLQADAQQPSSFHALNQPSFGANGYSARNYGSAAQHSQNPPTPTAQRKHDRVIELNGDSDSDEYQDADGSNAHTHAHAHGSPMHRAEEPAPTRPSKPHKDHSAGIARKAHAAPAPDQRRVNSFSVLGSSMADDDDDDDDDDAAAASSSGEDEQDEQGDTEDEEEDQDDDDAGSDARSANGQPDYATQPQPQPREYDGDDTEEEMSDGDGDEDEDDDAAGFNGAAPRPPAPPPARLINGKGGTSVADAIEL